MTSAIHLQHIKTRVAHNNCSECRADCERRFVDTTPWRYEHVRDYLTYVRACLAGLDDSAGAQRWYRAFRKALHMRISAKCPVAGRKRCDSYLERMGQFRRDTDAAYLRRFAARGASCL